MEEAQPFEQQTRERVVFLQGFLKRPLQVGSIIPSSRFLERRIIDLAEVRSAQTIVELGAGVGNTAQSHTRCDAGKRHLSEHRDQSGILHSCQAHP